MGKMKLFVVKSLDGFTARSNGDIDFILKYTEKIDYGFNEFLKTVDCVVCNQLYYQELQSCGRQLQCGELPCYILCGASFATPAGGNLHLLVNHDGFMEHILRLQKSYRNIWVAGDRHLITDCFDRDLIDELTVIVLPVTIGHGCIPMLGNSRENGWQIVEKESFENDVLKIKYSKKMQLADRMMNTFSLKAMES